MQVHLELDMEAISQLVSGSWPLLENLVLTLTDVNELVFSTIVTGDWPMLKRMHIDIKGNTYHWVRQQVDSWQTIEQGCYNVYKIRSPGLKLKLPDTKEVRERLDRQDLDRQNSVQSMYMSWVQQNQALIASQRARSLK